MTVANPGTIDRSVAYKGRKLFDTDVPLLTAKQLASRLSIDLKKVYRLVEAGSIPALQVGEQWRFIWEDVLGAIKEKSNYGNPEQ